MQHSAAGLFTTRVLVYAHRWLGIVLGALFAAWFVSGIVLMYAGMPRLSEAERLAGLPPLDFSTAAVAPADAARVLDQPVTGLRLARLGARPVYVFRSRSGSAPVYADDGSRVAPVGAEQALAQVRAFAPEHAATAHYAGYVSAPDQWTLEINRLLPMHRIALGDGDDTRLYVTEASGEIVLKTTASARRWAYPGAILHWIYLTPIRRHSEAWAQFIIWTSVIGTVMCVAGLAWGLWRYSLTAVYRLKREHSHTPYAGWMCWHHYAGLIFGVCTLTWIFSGLLSMDPWDWHPSTSPTAVQRLAFSGGSFNLDGLEAVTLEHALQQQARPRDASVVQFQGGLLLATDRGVSPLGRGNAAAPRPDDTTLARAMANALPDTTVLDVSRLDDYDAYYYDRDRELRLPVLRVRYADPQQTWLYVDPARGEIVRKEERLTRLNRWLYHGLHSLDFPFLYNRRPLWDIVVIALSLGGLALTLTTLVPAWRRLRRHAARLTR